VKRLHVHVAVADLGKSVQFYSTLFGAGPTVEKGDYAKWMLEDPRVNFAISQRGQVPGLSHLGIQAEGTAELEEIGQRLMAAEAVAYAEQDAGCCTPEQAAEAAKSVAAAGCCKPDDAGKPGCCA